MTPTRSQNHTNMVVVEHGTQTFKVVVVVVVVPTSAHLLVILDKPFVQLCLNVIYEIEAT